jgi:hypothetical protein
VLDFNGATVRDTGDKIIRSANCITTDVTHPVAVNKVFDKIADLHCRIKVLNNAGTNRGRDSMESSIEDWNAVTSVYMTEMPLCAGRGAEKHITHGWKPTAKSNHQPGQEATLAHPLHTTSFSTQIIGPQK